MIAANRRRNFKVRGVVATLAVTILSIPPQTAFAGHRDKYEPTVYIEPNSGLESYIAIAFMQRTVPARIVPDPRSADFVIATVDLERKYAGAVEGSRPSTSTHASTLLEQFNGSDTKADTPGNATPLPGPVTNPANSQAPRYGGGSTSYLDQEQQRLDEYRAEQEARQQQVAGYAAPGHIVVRRYMVPGNYGGQRIYMSPTGYSNIVPNDPNDRSAFLYLTSDRTPLPRSDFAVEMTNRYGEIVLSLKVGSYRDDKKDKQKMAKIVVKQLNDFFRHGERR